MDLVSGGNVRLILSSAGARGTVSSDSPWWHQPLSLRVYNGILVGDSEAGFIQSFLAAATAFTHPAVRRVPDVLSGDRGTDTRPWVGKVGDGVWNQRAERCGQVSGRAVF
jgi:hypothetical protein